MEKLKINKQPLSKQQLLNENTDLRIKIIQMENKLSKLSKCIKQLQQI